MRKAKELLLIEYSLVLRVPASMLYCSMRFFVSCYVVCVRDNSIHCVGGIIKVKCSLILTCPSGIETFFKLPYIVCLNVKHRIEQCDQPEYRNTNCLRLVGDAVSALDSWTIGRNRSGTLASIYAISPVSVVPSKCENEKKTATYSFFMTSGN